MIEPDEAALFSGHCWPEATECKYIRQGVGRPEATGKPRLNEAGRGMVNTLRELVLFFWRRKKFWVIPLVVMMVLLGVLQFLQGSAFAPFIYALF